MTGTQHTSFTKPSESYYHSHHISDNKFIIMYSDIDQSLQERAYERGKIDGGRDKEMELIKMAKTLYSQAQGKAAYITDTLVAVSEENNISVRSFYLKIEHWDKIKSLITVDVDDYIDDKIDLLYQSAFKLADELNCDVFHWDYLITYTSDSLNKEKITADGYNFLYEHTSKSREAQQEGL